MALYLLEEERDYNLIEKSIKILDDNKSLIFKQNQNKNFLIFKSSQQILCDNKDNVFIIMYDKKENDKKRDIIEDKVKNIIEDNDYIKDIIIKLTDETAVIGDNVYSIIEKYDNIIQIAEEKHNNELNTLIQKDNINNKELSSLKYEIKILHIMLILLIILIIINNYLLIEKNKLHHFLNYGYNLYNHIINFNNNEKTC